MDGNYRTDAPQHAAAESTESTESTEEPPAVTADVPPARRASTRRRRFQFFRTLRRLWIPLILAGVITVWGFSVSRIHGIFGSAQQPSYADAQSSDAKPDNAKQLVYQVFGPPGTVADISYFDANSDPQWVAQAPLPWSVTFPAGASGTIANLSAQGDSNSIGCRIVIDGEVKDERISHEVNAFTYCLLKAS